MPLVHGLRPAETLQETPAKTVADNERRIIVIIRRQPGHRN